MIRFLLVIAFLFYFCSPAVAIGPVVVIDSYRPDLVSAPEEYLPPIEAVQTAVDELNSYPYFPQIAEIQTSVKLVKQYYHYPGLSGIYLFSAPEFADRVTICELIDGSTGIYADCAATHTLSHEVGHSLEGRYATAWEAKAYVALVGDDGRESTEILAEDFSRLFGPPEANYLPPGCGSCWFKPRPVSHAIALWKVINLDLRGGIDFSGLPTLQGDVNADGRVDCVDVDLAASMAGLPPNQYNIEQFIPADMDRDGDIDHDDMQAIGKIVGNCIVIVNDKYDLNDDGKVDIKDKLYLSHRFGRSNDVVKFDLNRDGKVNILDLLELDKYMGKNRN